MEKYQLKNFGGDKEGRRRKKKNGDDRGKGEQTRGFSKRVRLASPH